MKILDCYHAPIRMLDWIVALFLVVVIVFLHVSFMQNAGGLWRDEVSTSNLATLPRLTDVFEALALDSFPLSSFLMLRAWAVTGWGASNGGLRTYGLIVGISILGALWFAKRLLGLKPRSCLV